MSPGIPNGVRRLLGPTGEPVSTRVTDVAPKELHGFKITVGLSPWPMDQPRGPGRKMAVVAELTPEHPDVVKRMRSSGKQRILGIVPVTPQAATELRLNPRGATAEVLARRAIAEASRLARTVAESAGGRATSEHEGPAPDLFPGAESFSEVKDGELQG